MGIIQIAAAVAVSTSLGASLQGQAGAHAQVSTATERSGVTTADAGRQQNASGGLNAGDSRQELTLSGCLMRHDQVPARSGSMPVADSVKHDGYLLVDAATVAHHKGLNGMRPPAAVGTAGAHDHGGAEIRPVVDGPPNAGDSQMFKVEGLSDAELAPFAGRTVTLMGDLISAGRVAAGAALAKDAAHDAAPFEATMIHPSDSPCRQRGW